MNISYLKPSMIDFMDSPVPYFIGMSDLLWNLEDGGGAQRWEAQLVGGGGGDDIVVVRLDQANEPRLQYQNEDSEKEIKSAPQVLRDHLRDSLKEIATKAILGTSSLKQKSVTRLSDREQKIYLKQALFNYLLLVISDLRPFFNDKTFNHLKYVESQNEDSRMFYQALSSTQHFNDLVHRWTHDKEEDLPLDYIYTCWEALSARNSFRDVLILE